MPKKVMKDTPLAEITLRKYEKPSRLSERDRIKKLCLSLGLLQPADSRDIIVDILHVLLKARKRKQALSAIDIQKKVVAVRRRNKLPLLGIAPSNVRRQLKRLRELLLVEKVVTKYRITEFERLDVLFEEKLQHYYVKSIVDRVKEYCGNVS